MFICIIYKDSHHIFFFFKKIKFYMFIGKIMIIVYNRYYGDIQPLSNQSVKNTQTPGKHLLKNKK